MKIERIGDMFQLLWLESVITEASLMTRNIKMPSIFMNWMCFHCSYGGALPPSRKPGGLGDSAPQPKPIFFLENSTKKLTKVLFDKTTWDCYYFGRLQCF